MVDIAREGERGGEPVPGCLDLVVWHGAEDAVHRSTGLRASPPLHDCCATNSERSFPDGIARRC